MKRWAMSCVVCLGLMAGGVPAWAQSRPLVTEDPETVPAGNILFEAGLEFQQDAIFPASGLTGKLWKIGSFGFSFGVSSIAEIQVDGGIRNRLNVTLRDPGGCACRSMRVGRHFGGGGSGSHWVASTYPHWPHRWTVNPANTLSDGSLRASRIASPHWGQSVAVSGSFRTSIKRA